MELVRNILIATDFSPASRLALVYAISVARRYRAGLCLAHIVAPDELRPARSGALRRAVDTARSHGERLLSDLAASGQLENIPHRLVVAGGEIWPGLSGIIQNNAIDLIVAGTGRGSRTAKPQLGSVAQLIFRRSHDPLLTVPPAHANAEPPGDVQIRRILYATDFSPPALHAAQYASSLAHKSQSHLIALHVIPEPPVGSPLQKSRLLEEAKTRLRALLPAREDLRSKPEPIVGFGTPATRILSLAAEKAADLIVLGMTRPGAGHAAAKRRWTTALEVAAEAFSPVLTVRAPGER